jgi:ATP-dependent Clp protease ATP-binding subunit ClpB
MSVILLMIKSLSLACSFGTAMSYRVSSRVRAFPRFSCAVPSLSRFAEFPALNRQLYTGSSRVPATSAFLHRVPALRALSSSSARIDNPLDPELYTEKAWEALNRVPTAMDRYGAQKVEAYHILFGLLQEGPNGLAQRIVSKAGLDPKKLIKKIEDHMLKQPRVSDTSQKSYGTSGQQCLVRSIALTSDFGDSFVSVEHLLLAAADTDGFSKQCFVDLNSSVEKLRNAVLAIRGSNKVISRNPEGSYEALDKYSVDLTARAAEGKLDPVIGRDEEIRRTIQILSRRSKNNPILLGEPGVGKF